MFEGLRNKGTRLIELLKGPEAGISRYNKAKLEEIASENKLLDDSLPELRRKARQDLKSGVQKVYTDYNNELDALKDYKPREYAKNEKYLKEKITDTGETWEEKLKRLKQEYLNASLNIDKKAKDLHLKIEEAKERYSKAQQLEEMDSSFKAWDEAEKNWIEYVKSLREKFKAAQSEFNTTLDTSNKMTDEIFYPVEVQMVKSKKNGRLGTLREDFRNYDKEARKKTEDNIRDIENKYRDLIDKEKYDSTKARLVVGGSGLAGLTGLGLLGKHIYDKYKE